ncbi:MAG: hypothetical protein QM763_02025 [Agriterribacter sp.]
MQGSSGVWGGAFSMPAHPSLSVPVADKLANWILSLKPVEKGKSPGMSGIINPNAFTLTDKGVIRIEASYKDKGFNGLPSLSARTEKVLLNPLITVSSAEQRNGITRSNEDGYYRLEKDSAVLTYHYLPLNGVRSIRVLLKRDSMDAGNDIWDLSVHLESPSGKRIAHTQINSAEAAVIALTGDTDETNPNKTVCFVWKKISSEKNKFLLNGFLLSNK